MHTLDNPGGFIVALLLFQLIPGPGSLNILRATAQHGTAAGFAAVAGTLGGGLACMLAAASGLEAVFRGQPQLLQLLQTLGSAYLAWLGWRLLQARSAGARAVTPAAPTLVAHARQALVVSLANPKVLLFYFALLPLFFRAPVSSASLATMVACVLGVGGAWQSLLVLGGQAAARRLAGLPGVRQGAERMVGVVLVGLAMKMLLLA